MTNDIKETLMKIKKNGELPHNIDDEVLREFDEKVQELNNAEIKLAHDPDFHSGISETFDFGYKIQRNNELFTVTDWGHIRKFLLYKIEAARRDEREKIKTRVTEFGGDVIALSLKAVCDKERKRLRNQLEKLPRYYLHDSKGNSPDYIKKSDILSLLPESQEN